MALEYIQFDKKPVILRRELDSGELSFASVLDTACERLWEKRIQYSIRRIREMDEELAGLERELDEFIENSVPSVVKNNLGISSMKWFAPIIQTYINKPSH